jgi:hypothetical protein
VTVDPDEHLDPLALVYRPVPSGTPSNSARHRAVGALESVVAKWSKGEYASSPTFTSHFVEYNQRNATFHDDHASLSTEKTGRVPRGRTEIFDFRDDETRSVSNHLTPEQFTVDGRVIVEYVIPEVTVKHPSPNVCRATSGRLLVRHSIIAVAISISTSEQRRTCIRLQFS